MSTVLWVLNAGILVYFLTLDVVYGALLLMSFWESGKHMHRVGFGGYDRIFRSPITLPISIIVPAYNEEATIVETVNAMRLLEYGGFEIIVVDDGSRDATLARLVERFALEPVDRPLHLVIPCQPIKDVYVSHSVTNLVVITKENGGKADALNAGINAARYPLFCAVDADAILESDALLRVVKPFMERPQETVAAAGIVRVVNGCKVSEGRIVSVARRGAASRSSRRWSTCARSSPTVPRGAGWARSSSSRAPSACSRRPRSWTPEDTGRTRSARTSTWCCACTASCASAAGATASSSSRTRWSGPRCPNPCNCCTDSATAGSADCLRVSCSTGA